MTVSPSSASSRVSRAMYGALIAGCLALWVLAFIAVSFKNQLIFAAAFVLASLLLPFAARRAGRPSFSVWGPALLCSGLYLLLCLGSRFQSPVVMSFVLVFHGALILFASPKPTEGVKGSETRAAIATKSHRLPRWAAATYFCVTAGLVAGALQASSARSRSRSSRHRRVGSELPRLLHFSGLMYGARGSTWPTASARRRSRASPRPPPTPSLAPSRRC